jgi:hypothetical protein
MADRATQVDDRTPIVDLIRLARVHLTGLY